MIVKITSKRQVTFPKQAMEAMGVKEGDSLVIEETQGGFLIKPQRVRREHLAPLRKRIKPDHPKFDLETFRDAPKPPNLRD